MAMASEGAVLMRAGNPLSAALTLRRLLIQIDPGELDHDHDGDETFRLAGLLERRAGSGRVVLTIDQAETLEPAALLALQQVAIGSGNIKIVFFGDPAFWQLLNGEGLTSLRQALNRPAAEGAGMGPAEDTAPAPERWPPATSRPDRRWWVASVVGLLITGLASALLAPGGLFHRESPRPMTENTAVPVIVEPAPGPPRVSSSAPASAPLPIPDAMLPPGSEPSSKTESLPVAPEPAASGHAASEAPRPPDMASLPAPAAGNTPPATPMKTPPVPVRPLTQPVSPPAGRADTRQLRPRTRFEQFVAASGNDIDSLSDDERDTLLGRFLAGQRVGGPEPDEPVGESRVVIHYNERSTTGETVNRLAEQAAPFAASVRTLAAANTPFMAEIRFFHPEDFSRARKLAAALHGVRSGWLIRDFSSYRPGVPLGTFEVWTPAR